MAARWPEKIPEFMADKMAQLDDPRTVRLYRLIGELAEVGVDEERLNAVADLMVEMIEESAKSGDLARQSEEMSDDAFVALLDSFATDAHPMIERLRELMAERGWAGWIRLERARRLHRLTFARVWPLFFLAWEAARTGHPGPR